ncbi:MAG TPA: MFS transporter [Usitatibacter sp.]|nr:MFS transporter [Usitatibacter sp.]
MTPGEPPLSRGFYSFLLTRFLSNAGNQILLLALAWQMYDLTSSAWNLGLVGLAQFVPTILLTIPSGHLADRLDRRRLIAAAIGCQLVAAAVLTLGTIEHWVGRELILALSVLIGVARALQMPAQQAILPKLVTIKALPRALAMSTSVMQVSVVAAPALGGFVYALGAAWAYGLCIVLLVSGIFSAMGIDKVPIIKSQDGASLATMFAGFDYMLRQPVVLGAISLDLFAVVLGGATSLLPIYAKDILHTGPEGLGLLRSAPAVGSLALGAFVSRHPIKRNVGRKMFTTVAVFGISILVFAYSTSFVLSLVALAVSGAADVVSVVIRQTLVQLETPDEMRGRVSAVNATFISTSNQLGEFRAGAMAAWLGTVNSAMLGGLGTLIVVALWMRLFPALAQRDRLVP